MADMHWTGKSSLGRVFATQPYTKPAIGGVYSSGIDGDGDGSIGVAMFLEPRRKGAAGLGLVLTFEDGATGRVRAFDGPRFPPWDNRSRATIASFTRCHSSLNSPIIAERSMLNIEAENSAIAS